MCALTLLAHHFLLECLIASRHQLAHLVPLVGDVLRGDCAIWVLHGAGDVVLLRETLHFLEDVHQGAVLGVGRAQRALELLVVVDQALRGLDCVHDKHVHQVFTRTVQPVVEGLQIKKHGKLKLETEKQNLSLVDWIEFD